MQPSLTNHASHQYWAPWFNELLYLYCIFKYPIKGKGVPADFNPLLIADYRGWCSSLFHKLPITLDKTWGGGVVKTIPRVLKETLESNP